MDTSRRQALKLSILGAIGGVTCASRRAAAASSPTSTPLTVDGRQVDGQRLVPVLTASGTMVLVPEEHLKAASAPADPAVRKGIPGRRWVMVIDLAACDGCGSCTKACNKMHAVPRGQEWLPVLTMQDAPETSPYHFPKPCFHCDEPPCTKVCPVDATFKREDGLVLIDADRCIGCRFCMVACPYSTRHFSWSPPADQPPVCNEPSNPETSLPRTMGTVEKCDFCPDHAARGELPPCTTACPHGVIYYGDEVEDAVSNGLGKTVRLSTLLEQRGGSRYMEELGTKPRVYYLPPRDRQFKAPAPASGAASTCTSCATTPASTAASASPTPHASHDGVSHQ